MVEMGKPRKTRGGDKMQTEHQNKSEYWVVTSYLNGP
jgi:hypothetical protein